MLFGAGLYREKFYTANMVYGFGTREYLATGYKAELVGGYSWGEFNDEMYLGTVYKIGGFTRAGYLMGSFTLGSYIDLADGSWHHSAVDVDLQWFSNLYIYRRNRVRQFLSLNYTQGWNRDAGSYEIVRFTRENGLEALKEHITGTNRMVLNIFKNDFFTSFGLGIRLKNERLIFSAIQLQLGVAFGKRGLVESEYYRISSQTRLEQYRYLPKRPEVVGFQ